MISLDRHIEILLLSNDCVIVPGFGGFMAHHVDARYDETDFSFLPPSRSIGFNPQLKMNDSLLVQSYIEAYDLSYPEALKKVQGEVRELKQQLEQNGEFELNDIGVLKINQEGNIEFTPCEAGLLTPVYYGLSSYNFEPLANLQAESKLATTERPVVTANKEIKLSDVIEPNHSDDSDKTISIKVSMLRNIAVACIAIVICLLFGTPLHNYKGVNQGSIDVRLLNKITPKEQVQGNIYLKKAPGKARKSIQTAQASQNTPADISKSKPFALVVASRVTRKNAVQYAQSLRRQGYQSARVDSTGSSVKVLLGYYATKEEAQKDCNRLTSSDNFPGIWVTHIAQRQ